MKDNKDIFDLFKNNEHKLNELPSDSAWDRLENRLENRRDQRPKANTFNLRNIMSMTAVLLMLVTIISVLSLLIKQNAPAQTASNEGMVPEPDYFELEEIGVYSDKGPSNYNIGSYKKQLKHLNTNPILEGDPSKELRVQKKVFVALRNKSNKAKNNTSSNVSPSAQNRNKVVESEANLPAQSQKKTTITDVNFAQFHWLLGKWEVPSDLNSEKKERSIEEWNLLDENNLSGKGYLLLDGKTTYSETMRIQKVGQTFFYVLKMGNEKQVRKYRLKRFNAKEITFENKNLPFPNQVILQPDLKNDTFTTLFQNDSPTQLDSEQYENFQKRNQISTEQIKRVMRKL